MQRSIPAQTEGAPASRWVPKAALRSDRSGSVDLVLPVLSLAILGVVLIMSILGTTLVRQYKAMQMRAFAETGSVYVEGFLAPHVHQFFATGTFNASAKADLRRLMRRLPAENHFEALKIWNLSGELLFNTLDSEVDENHETIHLEEVLSGEIVARIETSDANNTGPATIPRPFIEIYSPIYDPTDETIVAVGEIYQDATDMLRDRAAIERAIWTSIGAATFGLVGMLLLVGAQRRRLARQLAAQRRIAAENDALRSAADKARLDASHSNEQLLNHVGAELHDGPIQTLSLLMLVADNAAQGSAPAPKALVEKAMAEMRAISSGLILPELEGLTLAETILLAIDRHENLTGTRVERSLGALPSDISHAVKVCAYRLVQEGLNNAFRHAGGLGQQVEARQLSGNILIVVRDGGPGHPLPLAHRTDRAGLGLQAIRNRLEVHGGHLEVHFGQASGSEIRATLPLHPAGNEPPVSDQR